MPELSSDNERRLKALNVPIPRDERQRLATLRQCGCLDSDPSESFDRITRMCSKYFRVSALMNL
jgi:hypothetical protein